METTAPSFKTDDGCIVATSGGVTATLDGRRVSFAHLGCRVLASLPDDYKRGGLIFPRSLTDHWDSRFGRAWRDKKNVCGRLGDALMRVLEVSQLRGVVLWDTMRKGSDYWRPGKLLTDVAERVRAGGYQVSYARDDRFCPSAELLQEFRDTSMSFGEYASRYAQQLRSSQAVSLAALAVTIAQAQNWLAAFYCTDPYIPDYGDAEAMFTHAPYKERRDLAYS